MTNKINELKNRILEIEKSEINSDTNEKSIISKIRKVIEEVDLNDNTKTSNEKL